MTKFPVFLFASLFAYQAFADLKVPEVTRTRAKSLDACLLKFKEACGAYPTTAQGLDILAPQQIAAARLKCEGYHPCKEVQIDLSKTPTDPKRDFRTDGIHYDLQYTSDGTAYQLYWSGHDGKQRILLSK